MRKCTPNRAARESLRPSNSRTVSESHIMQREWPSTHLSRPRPRQAPRHHGRRTSWRSLSCCAEGKEGVFDFVLDVIWKISARSPPRRWRSRHLPRQLGLRTFWRYQQRLINVVDLFLLLDTPPLAITGDVACTLCILPYRSCFPSHAAVFSLLGHLELLRQRRRPCCVPCWAMPTKPAR